MFEDLQNSKTGSFVLHMRSSLISPSSQRLAQGDKGDCVVRCEKNECLSNELMRRCTATCWSVLCDGIASQYRSSFPAPPLTTNLCTLAMNFLNSTFAGPGGG